MSSEKVKTRMYVAFLIAVAILWIAAMVNACHSGFGRCDDLPCEENLR